MSAGWQWVVIFVGLLGGATAAAFISTALIASWVAFPVALAIFSVFILALIVLLVATDPDFENRP